MVVPQQTHTEQLFHMSCKFRPAAAGTKRLLAVGSGLPPAAVTLQLQTGVHAQAVFLDATRGLFF